MNQSAQDVVGVFDSGFNQLFEDARAMKATVKEKAKGMKSTVETGSTVTDHIVYEPTEIDLAVIIQAGSVADTYQEIKSIYLAATLVSIQTNTDTYDNMYITEMPHDETPEMYDAVAIAVRFSEADFVTAQYGQLQVSQVAKKSDASTVKTGEKTPGAVDNASTLDTIYHSVLNAFQ